MLKIISLSIHSSCALLCCLFLFFSETSVKINKEIFFFIQNESNRKVSLRLKWTHRMILKWCGDNVCAVTLLPLCCVFSRVLISGSLSRFVKRFCLKEIWQMFIERNVYLTEIVHLSTYNEMTIIQQVSSFKIRRVETVKLFNFLNLNLWKVFSWKLFFSIIQVVLSWRAFNFERQCRF